MIPVAIKKRTFIVCINPFDAKRRRRGLLRTAYIQDQTTQNVQSDLESRASVCLLKPIRYKNLSMILFSAFDRGPAVVLRADKLDPRDAKLKMILRTVEIKMWQQIMCKLNIGSCLFIVCEIFGHKQTLICNGMVFQTN